MRGGGPDFGPRRGFCRHCGSGLFWHRTGALRMAVAAGSLDQPTGLKVVQHMPTAPVARKASTVAKSRSAKTRRPAKRTSKRVA